MNFVIALLGLTSLAYAQDFPNLMGGMLMPQIPPGMKLDDLKDAFKNLPPAMKERIDSMAKSYGMSIDDVEQALDNPPEELKQMFEPDANPEKIQKLAIEKAKEMGFDLSDPEIMKETLKDQLRNIMPDMNMDELMQQPQKVLQATLKGMGIPSDDPKAIKQMVKEGLQEMGIENVDMDNMDDLVQKLKKKVFHMLDIDEKEDPKLLKERVKTQLFDQMHEMGINVKDDDDMETVQKKLTTAISKELNKVGVEVESDDPKAMMSAIKKKINEMGIKFDNMQELQNQLMGMFMQHAQSAFMNMMVPPSEEHKEPKMPPKMPKHMMPPHPQMQYPNLNLEISVNIEQTNHQMKGGQRPTLPIPSAMPINQIRAKEVSTDPSLSSGDDNIVKHIMQVRAGLRSGSISEDVVEEMLEDLLHYRLKNTLLHEKLDRIEEMNHAIPKDSQIRNGGNSRVLSAILNN